MSRKRTHLIPPRITLTLILACSLGPVQGWAEEGGPEGGAGQAGQTVGSTMRDVGLEFKKIGKAIGHTARDVGKGVGKAATEGGRGLKRGLKGEGDEERIK